MLAYRDREKQLECQRNHYRNNKQYYFDRNKRKALETKEWWVEFKKALKCSRCEENHPATLDCHHINPNEKDYNISHMINRFSKSRILKELEKCIILCSNCHRKYHYDENNSGE